MKPFPSITAVAILFAWAQSGLAMAQSADPTHDPCRAQPGTARENLPGGIVNDCDGILKPPSTGDGDIVEPAPDTGQTPVIPPSALPQQQSSAGGAATGAQVDDTLESYSIAGIVDAVARSAAVAGELEELSDPNVLIQDISKMLNGSDASILDTSLTEHAAGVEALRRAVSTRPSLTSALNDNGLSVAGVVAARIEGGDLTLFAR